MHQLTKVGGADSGDICYNASCVRNDVHVDIRVQVEVEAVSSSKDQLQNSFDALGIGDDNDDTDDELGIDYDNVMDDEVDDSYSDDD